MEKLEPYQPCSVRDDHVFLATALLNPQKNMLTLRVLSYDKNSHDLRRVPPNNCK
jgi:hypothetical protein